MPDFCGSFPIFIWIKILGFKFCLTCSSAIFFASFSLSKEWIKSNNFKPTAGCIALQKKNFLILLKIINKKTKIIIT